MSEKIIGIINRKTGHRFPPTEYLADYARNNQEQFLIQYEGDRVQVLNADSAGQSMDMDAPVAPSRPVINDPAVVPAPVKYTKAQLDKMEKAEVVAILAAKGFDNLGNPDDFATEDLVDLVLTSQK